MVWNCGANERLCLPDFADRQGSINKKTDVYCVKVVAVVIRRGDRYLIGQRPTHKHHGGLWEFPGGKVEPGETLSDAAERETCEELATHLARTGEVIAVVASEHIQLHFLEAWLTGEPVAVEHQALRWCSLVELRQMDLAPMDREFVEALSRPA
jgi:8-oxo-dGTP diphosphatase